MKSKVVVVFLSVLFVLSTVPATVFGWDVYTKAKTFTWKEYVGGVQKLEESGIIYGVGTAGTIYLFENLALSTKGEVFGGQVDYDGQTWAGVPVKTETGYLGFKLEGDTGWHFMLGENMFVGPFAGLGYKWWQRTIESTPTALGYPERWQSFYGRLGVDGIYGIAKNIMLSVEGGVKLPIYNQNKANLPGFGNVTVKPGKEASVFAEVALQYDRFKAGVFYEGMRFSKSPYVTVGALAVYQPESRADMYGFRAGVVF